MSDHVYVPVYGDRVYAYRFSLNTKPHQHALIWESNPIHPTADVIPVSGVDGLYVGAGQGIYHLDAQTGGVLHQWTQGIGPVHGVAYADGVLYFTAGDPLLDYFGLKLWALNLPSGQPFLLRNGVGVGTPVVGAGNIFVTDRYDKLYALSPNGSIVWTLEATSISGFMPFLTISGNSLYARTGGDIYKINAISGQVAWKVEPPVSLGWGLAVGSGHIYAIGIPDVGLPNVCALRDTDGSVAWEQTVSDPGLEALMGPEYREGRVFVAGSGFSPNGQYFLHALDASSGNQLWVSEAPVATGDNYVSVPAAGCGLVAVASDDGNFYAFNASAGGLEFKMPIHPNPGSMDVYHCQPMLVCEAPKPQMKPWGKGRYAIDPLALILPESVYAALKKPNPPPLEKLAGILRELAKKMKPADRKEAVDRAKGLRAYADAVEKSLGD